VESDGLKLSQEKIDEIIQLDGKTLSELLNSKFLVDKVSPRVPEEQVEFSVAPFANNCSNCNRDSSSNVFIDKKGKTVFLWPVCCAVCPENWNVHSIKPYRYRFKLISD
jgi:hypothetical protein